MAPVMNSLAGRFGVIVLVIHVVLLPVLYVQLDRIVTKSLQEMFITEIRTYARIVADEIELGTRQDSEQKTRALLENILLSGEGLFAELVDGKQRSPCPGRADRSSCACRARKTSNSARVATTSITWSRPSCARGASSRCGSASTNGRSCSRSARPGSESCCRSASISSLP